MARVRSPNRDKAFEIYKQHKGDILLKDIATQLGVKDTQIRKWKSQDKWEEKLKGTLLKNKRNVTDKKDKSTYTKKLKKTENSLSDELTEKQKLFCIYYIENFNATKAYQKAYECDYQTAKTNASRMLTKANIKVEIDRLTEECLEEQEINSKLLSKRLFQKYIDIAFSDITDYITFGKQEREGEFGPYTINYVDLKDSNNVDGSLISEISQGKDGIKIKLQDKMKALQWLSDRTDMLSDKDRYKLDLEITKTELAMLKQGGNENEVEDDGFIEALNAQVEEVWNDD